MFSGIADLLPTRGQWHLPVVTENVSKYCQLSTRGHHTELEEVHELGCARDGRRCGCGSGVNGEKAKWGEDQRGLGGKWWWQWDVLGAYDLVKTQAFT